jgi:general stress protein 26
MATATLSLTGIARHMRKIDICMMNTQSPRGGINSRPMSNNGDVTYKGDSYFFTYEGSQKIKDITATPQVSLNFEGEKGLYITITGKAKLIRAKAQMEEHWIDSLRQWFKDGLNTPGIVLIHVKGQKIKYWQKNKEGEIKVAN